jgi:6-phosphofructokinase 1
MGRRDSIIMVAEGARDREGKPITSQHIKQVLEERLGEDTRVTILGHVQRGGSPSAFDRNLSTLLGYAAVEEILSQEGDGEPKLIGMRGNRITRSPLMHCVLQTQSVSKVIDVKDYEQAMDLRGASFKTSFRNLRTMMRAHPHKPVPGQTLLRLAVMNSGGLAPGMNTAVRAFVRLGIDRGHTLLGVYNGFEGLIDGDIREMNWMSVNGWMSLGGSELGTNRRVPEGRDFYAIARAIEEHNIQGLFIIGGWAGYQGAHRLFSERERFPAFNIPIICLPASIENDLPGTELSIGADTALNNIVLAVDKIKQTAVATRRCFVVEVMGRFCGYLALMSGLATGAERVYLNEEGIALEDLLADLNNLISGFNHGKRLGLMIRSENAHPIYTTDFLCRLFEAEGGDLFEVRETILGHLQEGGNPTPFDRIQATRMVSDCLDVLISEADKAEPGAVFLGMQGGQVQFLSLYDLPRMTDPSAQRPKEQWWMELRPIVRLFAQSGTELNSTP